MVAIVVVVIVTLIVMRYEHDIEGSPPEWCISSMISRVPHQSGVSQA